MKAAVEANKSNIKSAFGQYLPAIQFNMGYSRQLNAEGGRTVNVGGQIIPIGETPPNSYNMGLSAGMNLFDGFGREANFKYASLTYDKNLLTLEQSKVYVKLSVYRKFFEYSAKKQVVQTRLENLEAGKKELESIRAKEKAGVLPIYVVYSKEAEIGALELDLSRAENEVNLTRASMLSLMGLNPTSSSDFSTSNINTNIQESDFATFRARFSTIENLIKDALKTRFDIQAQNKQNAASSMRISAAKSAYFPTLQLGGGWSWSNTVFDQFSEYGRSYIGLNLSLPIFTGFTTDAQVQQAQYEYKSQEYASFSKEQQVRTEIEQTMMNLDASEQQVKISGKSLFSAEMNYKILKERFNVGTANITELIQANSQYLNAKINQISSVFSYLLAQKELEYAVGRMN
jgi:outer membrane protein